MIPRVAIWVQTRLGLGHLTRARNLATALVQGGFDVILLSGGMPQLGRSDVSGVRERQLPPAQSLELESRVLLDENGSPITDDWRNARAAALEQTLNEFDPNIVVTEMFPIGRRLFAFEWRPLFEKWRGVGRRPMMVCSARDIVVSPSGPASAQEMRDLLASAYDLILCHGDPEIIRLEESCPDIAPLNIPTIYTGYLCPPNVACLRPGGSIVVSAGGGAAGEGLYATAIAARALWRRDAEDWTLVLGPNFPNEALRRIVDRMTTGIRILPSVANLVSLVGQDGLLVSQAGYNTVVEALSSGVKLLAVPYESPKETEQATRAKAFAARGWLSHLSARELTPNTLCAEMEIALTRTHLPPMAVDHGDRACAAMWTTWRNWKATR